MKIQAYKLCHSRGEGTGFGQFHQNVFEHETGQNLNQQKTLTNGAWETRTRILTMASLALDVSILVVSVQMAAKGTVLLKMVYLWCVNEDVRYSSRS